MSNVFCRINYQTQSLIVLPHNTSTRTITLTRYLVLFRIINIHNTRKKNNKLKKLFKNANKNKYIHFSFDILIYIFR